MPSGRIQPKLFKPGDECPCNPKHKLFDFQDRPDAVFCRDCTRFFPRDRQNERPTFTLGEEVILKGGRFKVIGITDKRIYLESLPRK